MKSAVKAVRGIQIIDSRGNPTVAVRIGLEDGSVGEASAPSGASTGEFEAVELRDGNHDHYLGQGVQLAVSHVNQIIGPALLGMDAADQCHIDHLLIELDGSKNKHRLGANAILAVSLAAAHAGASSRGLNLYQHLRPGGSYRLPMPLVNAVNGGVHADSGIDIQEFMFVPLGARSFAEAVRICAEAFHTLRAMLHDDGYETGVGDSGGYAPRIQTADEMFDFLLRAIERAGYLPGRDIALALDLAASELIEETPQGCGYRLACAGQNLFTSSQLIDLYEDWIQRYPIVSIEDGVAENDLDGWAEITARLGERVQLVGDDVFWMTMGRISDGIEERIGNALLFKLNQLATLSETLEAIEISQSAAYRTVISHRSGDTVDTTIADLAVAVGADQIKAGGICRGERVAKYNRLLWIEDQMGPAAFAGMEKSHLSAQQRLAY